MSAPTGFDTTLVTRETSTSPTPAGLACSTAGSTNVSVVGNRKLATTATSEATSVLTR